MTTLALRTINLSLGVRPGAWVLDGLSLSIEAGWQVVLAGGSGTGKSLLLHALFGFFPAHREGAIEVFGQPIAPGGDNPARRRMGLVFQNPEDQFICATVEEELRFGPENLDLSEADIERNLARYSKLLGLEGLLERPPLALSWGEKKRVALASVLVAEPEILLADDPFSGLSPEEQAWVAQALTESKATRVVASPQLPPPEDFGTHWGVLERGRLARFGRKEEFR